MRRIISLAAALCLTAGALTACSSKDGGDKASSTPSASTSASADASKPAEKVDEKLTISDKGMPTVTINNGQADFKWPGGEAPKGLQAAIVKEGTGKVIEASDTIALNYAGRVWGSDKEFDSSFKRKAPAVFGLSGLIRGWQIGLEGQKVGTVMVLSIPSALGYPKGTPSGEIKPGDTIVFYIEVLGAFDKSSAGQADATVEVPADKLPVEIVGDLGKQLESVKVKAGQAEPTGGPKATVIARGTGKPVEKNQTMVVNYAVTSWDNKMEENNVKLGQVPFVVPAQEGSFFETLVGVPTGSRVLITNPAHEGAPAMALVVDVIDAF